MPGLAAPPKMTKEPQKSVIEIGALPAVTILCCLSLTITPSDSGTVLPHVAAL